LQGLGGGGMAPSEQAILADTFPPERRAQAFALYGVAVVVAPTVGPALGGWITDNWSWNWIFFINVPVGIVSLVLVQWLLVEPEALRRERAERLAGGLHVDWTGFILVALWLGCMEVVLDKGQREDWFQSNFINFFATISVLALVAFVPWELTRRDPIVDIRLLLRRQFGTSFLVMLAVGAILFSTIQLVPQLLQSDFAYTAELSGLVLMPGGLVMLFLMPIAGRLTNYIRPKYLIAGGTVVTGLGLLYMTSLSPDSDFGFFARARVYQMVGLPFLFIPITTASYAGLPSEKTNEAASLINVARNEGGSIGVSLATTLLAQREQFHQARLTEHATPSSLEWQASVQQASEHFVNLGASRADAQHQAYALIGQMIQTQSELLSYIDVYFVLAIIAFSIVPLALLLRPVEQHTGPRAH
jgi:DHA2 family multidrug resistance protein